MTWNHTKSVCFLLALVGLTAQDTRADLLESEFAATFSYRQEQGSPDFSGIVLNQFGAINAHIDANELEEALQKLERLQARSLGPHEEAAVWQMSGYVLALQNKVRPAIESFQNCLALNVLPEYVRQDILYNLANLYASDVQYLKAAQTMHEWMFFEEDPRAESYMLMGGWFAALERYDDGLPFIMTALDKSDTPYEGWYELAVAIHFAEEKFAAAIPLLKEMLSYWPRKQRNWEYLVDAYIRTGDEKAALDAMMAAYNNGLIRDADRIVSLAVLNLYHEIPHTAATIMENEMYAGVVPESEEKRTTVMQAWIAAREHERAVQAIRKLVVLSGNESIWLEAARLQMIDGAWAAAAESAAIAIASGTEELADAYLLRGIALSESGRYAESLQDFREVIATGSAEQKNQAERWMRYSEQAAKNRKLLAAN